MWLPVIEIQYNETNVLTDAIKIISSRIQKNVSGINFLTYPGWESHSESHLLCRHNNPFSSVVLYRIISCLLLLLLLSRG